MSGPMDYDLDGPDGYVTTERAEEAFVEGAQACREMMARFVEQGGHPEIAMSIRANWHPGWGEDLGAVTGPIPISPWGDTEAMPCHCIETWPQLRPGTIAHGPGCPQR